MIVLTEVSNQLSPSAGRQDLQTVTAIAQLLGFPVYSIPPDFHRCKTAENALFHIPAPLHPTPALWLGYIPTPERYGAIYAAALEKRLHLVNTPEQHLTLLEFDRAYPHLVGITPTSLTVTHPNQCRAVAENLGFPIFVRGAVQSRKTRGYKACVAYNLEELQHLTQVLLEELPAHSRGRVILREWIPLRHDRTLPNGFPMGREFRVVVYQQRVISYGYAWEGEDGDRYLSVSEEEALCGLALEAARRLGVPFVAIDVAQREDGTWTVIETGDPQFCGLTQMPLIQFWHELETA